MDMKLNCHVYNDIFARPASIVARIVLFVSIFSVWFAFKQPLWTLSFTSNQYPDPLRMSIYVNRLEGQKTDLRDDLREINSLNHYIGMKPLAPEEFPEFTWLPFAVGLFVLLILRAVVFGTLRDSIDIAVLYLYFGLYSAWDFYHRLWTYGHELSPDAPIKVDLFTPPLYGTKQIANFSVDSYPGGGAIALAVFGALIYLALVIAFLTAWLRMRAERRVLRELKNVKEDYCPESHG